MARLSKVELDRKEERARSIAGHLDDLETKQRAGRVQFRIRRPGSLVGEVTEDWISLADLCDLIWRYERDDLRG